MAGSVTPGTVEEMVLIRLLDTPDLQCLSRRSPGGVTPDPEAADDHVENPSILDTAGLTRIQCASLFRPLEDSEQNVPSRRGD
jgi:hypothetical protein